MQQWQTWQTQACVGLPDDVRDSLPRVWAASPFVAQHCLRDSGLLAELVESGDLQQSYSDNHLRGSLQADQQAAGTQTELMRSLRLRRHRELVRIAWRDLAGWASLEETLRDLSDLAEACTESALAWLERDFAARHGAPLQANGQPARLIVLGMGKLGGYELNFSSDIDLIYAFHGRGETAGPHPLGFEEYFTRLARALGQVLSEKTAEGFVYRVDTLLRPFGNSGPLAMHVDAMEQYYQIHGREWERYALIKARPIAGDRAAGEQLLKTLRPFVYRRYLDFSAFESLREMKTLIEQQLHRKGYRDNIKLGAGGIREVEFVAQAFQLIRGGHDPALQQCRLMPVLNVLEQEGLLPEFAVRSLREGYQFLRNTENRLQAWQDQQTHELPQDEERRQALALAMGHADWDGFHHALERHRRRVHQQFEQVFAAPQAREADAGFVEEVSAIWAETLSEQEALEVLKAHGLPQAHATLEFLHQLRRSSVYRGLGEQGRRRFSQLLPLLFGAVAGRQQGEVALLRLLQVIEALAGRTTYLALLVESPMALSQLVTLCAASPWITRLISRHPVLLDELLDPRTLYQPAPRAELERELAAMTDPLPLDDLEAQMDLLRRLKQAWVLHVAAADVSGSMRLMVVSDHLTDIAEILVAQALKIAMQQMVQRHGRPLRSDGSEAGFAVVAYGKLGGIELGYGSDLDLVFIHDAQEGHATDGERPLDQGAYFIRLGQKLIHILTAQMPSGIVYEVDMRLRPSGNSGLLVTSLNGLRNYQREHAWTWEHQALVRARPIAGSASVGEAFTQLRREVLCQPRDPDSLREEIRAMRQKMRESLGDHTTGRFDLKHGVGGMTDIEFMVQYLVLRDAAQEPELVRYSDNIRQLEGLSRCGALSAVDAGMLADAYRAYRKRVHALTLQELPAIVEDPEFAEYRAGVRGLWDRLLEQPQTRDQEKAKT